MKLSTESKGLKTALTTLTKVVRNQTSIPICACVKLESLDVGGGRLRLTGTDLDTWASVELPADIEGTDSALVSLKSLRDALKPIPTKHGHHVELELDSESVTVGYAKLPVMTLEDYPVRGELNGSTRSFAWPAGSDTALKRALIAATDDDSRYFLQSIQVTPRHLNATDGHRLMRVENPLPMESCTFDNVLVPLQLATLTARVGKSDPITWSVDDSHIQAEVGSWTFLSKYDSTLKFPDSDKVMPSAGSSLTCHRSELLDALQSILPFTNERSHCVKLTIDESAIHLESTNAESGSACAQVYAHVSGDPISIGYNAEYLIDPLKLSQAELVTFKWKDASGPAELTAEDWRYVIMPMRLS
jgi:DNA polymerase-3 subunit beta